ncbi:MAG: hypothetical protein ACK5L3_01280, partial [Oscillospiraceae bacterium]
RKVIQAAANQSATLSPAKIDAIANQLLPLLDTTRTNAELWQLSFKMPALLSGQAAQMTVPREEDSWGIQLANGRVVIGCDFAAEAERLNQFITGVLPPEAESSSSVAASSGASSGSSSHGSSSSSSSYGGRRPSLAGDLLQDAISHVDLRSLYGVALHTFNRKQVYGYLRRFPEGERGSKYL